MVNLGGANPWAVDSEIARLVLRIPAIETEPLELLTEELELYAGLYLLGDLPLPFTVESGRLSVFGRHYVPIGQHVFVAAEAPETKLEFSVGTNGVESARMVHEGIETLYQRT